MKVTCFSCVIPCLISPLNTFTHPTAYLLYNAHLRQITNYHSSPGSPPQKIQQQSNHPAPPPQN